MDLWILIFLLYVGFSYQCEDKGGKDYCNNVLKQKSSNCNSFEAVEIYQCQLTCEQCKPSDKTASQSERPPWAATPINTRRRNNNNNNRSDGDDDDDSSLALPLYVVIIIVVALLIIFIGITVVVLKLRKKWKKRKTRKLLRNAQPPPKTLQRSYMWGNESYNTAYQPEVDGWSRNMYIPEEVQHEYLQNQTLNNAIPPRVVQKPEKNINILQNGTKDKRRAPAPPKENADAESTYQNLHQATNGKLDNMKTLKSTITPKSEERVVEIPIEYSESIMSEATPQHDVLQKNGAISNNFVSWDDERPPVPPPRIPNNEQKKGKKQNNIIEEEDSQIDSDESLENSTVRLNRSLSQLTANTQETSPALANILNEWKEHLQDQKKELEDYYKNLANYVKRLGLKPVGAEQEASPSNDRAMQDWIKLNQNQKHRNKSEPVYNDQQYASINEEYFSSLQFPEPPESVRGDFNWEPNDAASQKQVIVDLKKKLSRLQNLLENTQEMTDNDKKSSAYYIPSQHSKNTKYNGRNNVEDRVTIKALLRKLEERERLKVQMRIAQALDTSRNRGGMNIGSRDGPITCLTKQVHHVMNDILDPRTSTKIELGAHAACTLANKLAVNVRSNLLPVINTQSHKQNVTKTTDRIVILTKQLLDMTKQLMARQSSFQSKDYSVFVNAFVDTTEKIMDTTFHLVCVIVDLQRAERRGLIGKGPQNRKPSSNMQRPSLQSAPGMQNKHQLLSRLHSESNSTSLSGVDVRRLNEDLAKLRQLLNTETQLPSLSDITVSRPLPARNYNGNLASDFDTDMPESDCETMSTMSCSTCLPIGDDQYFYSGDMPPHPMYLEPPKFPSPPFSNTKKNNEDKVNYAEIVFDPETHRPATRPQKNGNHMTLPAEINEKTKPLMAGVFDLDGQVDSRKNSQKASTLQPSSFASYQSNQDVMTAEAQPRHEAMLARYFGGETVQPQITEPEKVRDKLKETLQQQAAHSRNDSDMKQPDADVECPMVTMLPCGLVANDTPPIANPPKVKRVKMPNIPEITVLRNGTEQSHPPMDEGSEEDIPPVEDDVKQIDLESDLKEPYTFTDTLPLHEKHKESKIEPPKSNIDDADSNHSSIADSFSEKLCADFSDEEGNFEYNFPLEDSDENLSAPEYQKLSKSNSSEFDSVVNRDLVKPTQPNSYAESPLDRNDMKDEPNLADNDGLVSEFEFPRVESSVNDHPFQLDESSNFSNNGNSYIENDPQTQQMDRNEEPPNSQPEDVVQAFFNPDSTQPQSENKQQNIESAKNADSSTDDNFINATSNNEDKDETNASAPRKNIDEKPEENKYELNDHTINEPIYDTPAGDDLNKKTNYGNPNGYDDNKKTIYDTPNKDDDNKNTIYDTPAADDYNKKTTYDTPTRDDHNKETIYDTPAGDDHNKKTIYDTPTEDDNNKKIESKNKKKFNLKMPNLFKKKKK